MKIHAGLASARVALGAVAPIPLFIPEVGAHLAGKAISNEVIDEAAQIAAQAATPISDYNKYIVNSGITMGTLLSAYEDFPLYFDTLNTNIPESKDAVPDILNEALYNLRWMLTMQDPYDGGVYNKCTNAFFDGMVMPGVSKLPRYVVQKGTAAALDFAAVMERMRRLRAGISHHDSAHRFHEELGVDVFLGDGRFSGPDTIDVAGKTLRFKRAVIASGARAVQPNIPGLAEQRL